jgi:hypothetical protein
MPAGSKGFSRPGTRHACNLALRASDDLDSVILHARAISIRSGARTRLASLSAQIPTEKRPVPDLLTFAAVRPGADARQRPLPERATEQGT